MHLETMWLRIKLLFVLRERPPSSLNRLTDEPPQVFRRVAATRKYNIIGISRVPNVVRTGEFDQLMIVREKY
jgi:hypothetical protein